MPDIVETTDAAAGTATAYILGVGQTAQGTLGANGDHDWYRVDLVAGQTYTFAMTGIGSNNVLDPYLRLYNSSGATLLAENDDGLPGANSVFTYTATASGAHYIDAAAYNNIGTGQYGISVTPGSRASLDLQMGAGVIDTDLSWSSAGMPATVSYGFRATNNGGEATFAQVTAAQMAAVQSILAMYSEVANLTFNQVNPGGYTDNATMLFAAYNENDGAGAYAYYPGSTASTSVAGDVWLNSSVSTTSLPAGGYSYFATAHEIGHAVGLSHPGLYNAAPGVSITYAANAQFTQDTHQYSVMSYFDESNTTGSYGSYPDTLMLFDVYALQQIYGANYATRAGNTVYGFNSNAGGVYDFAVNTNPALCIWDGGGTDTLDVSGYSQNQVISLIDGTFSNIGGLTGNVSIALGATIENAIGGSGGDTIHLSSQNIANFVNGNGNVDTVYVTYAFGIGYTIQSGGTAANFVMVGSAGTDTFLNIEFVHFANGTTVSSASLIATPASMFTQPTLQLAAFGVNAGGWSSDDTYPRELADVNGDGLADIVGFGRDWVYVSLATGGGAFGPAVNRLAAFGVNAGGWSSDNTYPRELADVNGDGLADIVGFANNGVHVALATGGGSFGQPTLRLAAFGTNAGGWSSEDTYPRELADVNGDGLADIVGFGRDWVYVALATGGGSFAAPTTPLAAFGVNAGGWSSDNTYPRELADVNGDGMADIVGFANNGVHVALATGGGSFGQPTLRLAAFGANAGGWSSDNTYPRELADVNGDGMADIVGFGRDWVYVALATGGGSFGPAVNRLAAFGVNAGGWSSDNTYPRELADVNGDGRDDIVGFANNGVHVSIANDFQSA